MQVVWNLNAGWQLTLPGLRLLKTCFICNSIPKLLPYLLKSLVNADKVTGHSHTVKNQFYLLKIRPLFPKSRAHARHWEVVLWKFLLPKSERQIICRFCKKWMAAGKPKQVDCACKWNPWLDQWLVLFASRLLVTSVVGISQEICSLLGNLKERCACRCDSKRV